MSDPSFGEQLVAAAFFGDGFFFSGSVPVTNENIAMHQSMQQQLEGLDNTDAFHVISKQARADFEEVLGGLPTLIAGFVKGSKSLGIG